jgi:hypothetical protein
VKTIRLLTLAALAAFFTSAHSIEKDKQMHAGVSFFLGMAAAHQLPDRPVLAWGIAMVPGLIKEVSDRKGTGFDGKDLLANGIGAALGVATTHWILSRSNGTTVVAYRTEF